MLLHDISPKWRKAPVWNPLHVVGQEALLLKQFNRRFTLRRLPQYGDPRIANLPDLRLPRGSILHHFPLRNDTIGPPNTLSYLSELEKNARVRHHKDLASIGTIGKPIKVPVQGQDKAILEYHRNNRNLRRYTDDTVIESDPKVLLIENYTPIIPHHRYPDTLLSWYERLYNYLITILQQLSEDSKKYNRQNYIVVELGDTLPAYAKFLKAMKGRTNDKLKDFNDGTLTPLWLLELFGFFSGQITNSVFSELEIYQLRRINFIFTHNSGFANFNLGEIIGWSKVNDGAISEDQMGRRFYASLVKLMTTAPEVGNDEVSPDDTVSLSDEDINAEIDIDDSEFEEEIKRFEETIDSEADDEQDISVAKPVDVKPTTIVVEDVIKHEDVVLKEVEKLAEAGVISAKRYNVIKESATNIDRLPNPYDPKSKLSYREAMTVTAEDMHVEPLVLSDSDTILDKSWAVNYTDAQAKKYNKTVLQKDILSAVASAQRLNIVIHDHKVEKNITATGNYELHRIKLQPFGGEPQTVYFQIPMLDEDGYWTANGVKYTMRPQRVDKPIRKVDFDTVSMTTGYGKNFVTRSDKVVNDRGTWLGNQLVAMGIGDSKEITDIHISNSFDPLIELPREYTTVSRRVSGFKAKGFTWNFDHAQIPKVFDQKVVDKLAKDKLIPVARGVKGVIAMDMQSQLYLVNGDKMESLPRLVEYLGIDQSKEPHEVSELSLMGTTIPLGLIFSYYFGLRGMLDTFNVRYEVVAAGTRTTNTESDMVIRLADSKYIIHFDNDEQRLVVNGLRKYLKHMVRYTEGELENEDVYLNLIAEDGLNAKYLKELTRMRNGYVDDMHERKLKAMGEPTTFVGLLRRANEMLTSDHSRPEINADDMMLLGNQRIAHHVFNGLVKASRNYDNQLGSNRKFELTNSMIWGAINEDPSVLTVQEANPVQSVKEKDVVTVGGTGGRKRITMVERTRKFDKSDLGIMSGDTVDNQDAGATTFRSASPIMQNIDGFTAPRDVNEMEMANLLSFIVGMSPGASHDEDKRRNFINIQYGSAQATMGNVCTPYRTGVEQLLAHRTSSMHARVADEELKVVEVTDKYITVKDKKGNIQNHPIGLWFGNHEGGTYQHENVTKWKKGDTIPARSIITYNKNHFEVDMFNPTQVNFKNGVPATIAFIEGEPVFEDSSAIHIDLANKLKAPKTSVKTVELEGNNNLYTILGEGAEVGVDTVLCTFADYEMDADDGEISSKAAAALANLDMQSPKAKVKGQIMKVEVYYHGDLEDFNPSLQKIAKASDKRMKEASIANNGLYAPSGQVDGSFRIEGKPLPYGSMAIRFYITSIVPMSGGDKGVIANQMKTTIQYTYTDRAYTEGDITIDGYFGRVGVEARIVYSLHEIGTTCRLSYTLGKHVKEIAMA